MFINEYSFLKFKDEQVLLRTGATRELIYPLFQFLKTENGFFEMIIFAASILLYWKCMYFIHNQTREMSWSSHISKKSTLRARFSLKPVLSLVRPVRFLKRFNPRKPSKRISFLIILHLIKMNVNKVSKIL